MKRIRRVVLVWACVSFGGCGGGGGSGDPMTGGGGEGGGGSATADAGGGASVDGADLRFAAHPDGWDVGSWRRLAEGDRVAWRWLDASTTGLPLRVTWADPNATGGPHRLTLRLEAAAAGPPPFEPERAEQAVDVVFEPGEAGALQAAFDLPLGEGAPAGGRLMLTAAVDDGPDSAPLTLLVEDAYPRDPCADFAPTLGTEGGCVEAVIPMPGTVRADVVGSGDVRACGELATVYGWLETTDRRASECLRSRGRTEFANSTAIETNAVAACLVDAGWGRLGGPRDVETELRFAVDGRDCGEGRFVLISDVGSCACED